MLEFVDSGLYFVKDKNNFICPLSQVVSGSGRPKINGSGRPKSTDPTGSGSSSLTLLVKLLSYLLTDKVIHEGASLIKHLCRRCFYHINFFRLFFHNHNQTSIGHFTDMSCKWLFLSHFAL